MSNIINLNQPQKNDRYCMNLQPTLQTEQLTLRPFALADAADVQHLAGDRMIAARTLSIPHPYESEMAEAWIETLPAAFEQGNA
ncbi:MAG: GNAT family N-acetyltransferase, partial [Coleofasciculus sp. S288]|nr:GNAT family N-acetyltransferase [Coleofasciculus sp. S288]